MPSFLETLLHSDHGAPAHGLSGVVFGMLLALLIGQVIGWVYQATHRTLSYSQTFVASLVVMPPLVGLMMSLVAGSIALAFGMVAVFAMVRFRNVLKDTRDTTFMLWAIIEGLAVGTQRYSTAVVTGLCMAVAFAYLRLTLFGCRHTHDVSLRVSLLGDLQTLQARLREILDRHCERIRSQSAAAFAPTSGPFEVSYSLLLRNPARHEELRQELSGQAGLSNVSLVVHHEEWEM